MKHLTYSVLILALMFCRPANAIASAKIDPPAAASLSKGISTDYRYPELTDPRKRPSKNILNTKNADDYFIESEEVSYFVMQMINVAESKIGSGYHTGGTNADTGFDCSGLMFSTFKKFDIILPRSSNDMAKMGQKLDSSEIRKGDLIFFRTNGKSVINHVGMVTEVLEDEIKFVHSSTQKGVIISSTKEPYYERTFAQANRISTN